MKKTDKKIIRELEAKFQEEANKEFWRYYIFGNAPTTKKAIKKRTLKKATDFNAYGF